jgi:hypothetical protein
MRIFISSTFRDLQSERDKTRQVLEKMDMLSRRMEIFVSEPIRPIDVALRELRESDAVVLIIGFRAGSLVEKQSGRTYTRAEFDLACELKKPIFAFIKTDHGCWRNEEESPSLAHALDDFMGIVKQERTLKYFNNPDNLAEEIALAIERWEHMGRPGARSTFSSWEEYFPSRVGLFDYEQTLQGRSKEIHQLHDFLTDEKHAVGVLLGRGGVGKSKLLRDWSQEISNWQPFFLREGATWQPEAPKEIPAGRILIIADDAHRFPELRKLLILCRDLFEARGCKLLICARPSGQADIDEALARTFDVPSVHRFPALDGLQLRDSEKLAEEVLGHEFAHIAGQLAAISADAPLVTVVGGRLIRRNQISPLLLTNESEFRRAVFDKYVVEYEHLLPRGAVAWRDLLALIAALSPLSINDPEFLRLAVDFLRLRDDQILQATDTLEKHGLLIRRSGAVRIVPDVLSDYLLEQACVQSDGEPTRFADEVFDLFQSTHLATSLRNLAELDWRIAHKGSSSGLLNRVWNRFFQQYMHADAAARCRMLESFKDAAFFQPSRAIELAQYSVANPVLPTDDVGCFQSSQTDVLHKLPDVLQNVAYHGAYLDRAIKLLWILAKQDTRDTNPHPTHALRILQDLASYGRYKTVDFYLKLADTLSDLLSDPGAFDSRYTPLDVIDKLLEKEGEHQESDGMTLRLGAFALSYDRVREIRRRALAMVETCLAMDRSEASARAVKSLSNVISGLAPKFGRSVTDDELVWQDAERIEALEIVSRRINPQRLPVPLARELRNMLRHFGRSSRQGAVHDSIKRLLDRIGYSDDLLIYDTFCTSVWDYDVICGELGESARRFSIQVQKAKALFRQKFPNPLDQIAALEEMLSEGSRNGVDAARSCFSLLESVCHELDFRVEFSRYIFAGASPNMAFQIRVLLPVLRDVDEEEYLRLASAAVKTATTLALGAANAICFGGTLKTPKSSDLKLLALLSQHEDTNVRSMALTGIGRVGATAAWKHAAIELALNTDIGSDCALAEELTTVFHPSNIDPDCLTPAHVATIFKKLILLGDLDRPHRSYHLSAFLDWACRRHPDLTLEFVLARLDYSSALNVDSVEKWSYEAVPHHEARALFQSFNCTVQYPLVLAQIRDRLVKGSHSAHNLTDFFWSVGQLDLITLSIIDVWLHSGDQAKFAAILHLIRAAPCKLPFSFPYFALHVLWCASEFGDTVVKGAMGDLLAGARNQTWLGGDSAAPSEMVLLRDEASRLAQMTACIPEGSRLFSAIAAALSRDIDSWVRQY